jgi:CRP-like cAMP-binding protein
MKEKTKKTLENFFSKYPLKKYKKGDILFQPGEEFNGVIFVKSGYLRVYSMSRDGKETSIQLFKPLFYLSIISSITDLKNRHFIEAISPVEVWVAPKNEFLEFIRLNTELTHEIMGSFLRKFLELTSQMVQIIAGDAYTKVAGLICSMADEFGVNKGKKTTIKFKITHKLIASLTGLTRETVTLQMLKLEKDGLIDNDKREIVVQDMEKLKKMLGYE